MVRIRKICNVAPNSVKNKQASCELWTTPVLCLPLHCEPTQARRRKIQTLTAHSRCRRLTTTYRATSDRTAHFCCAAHRIRAYQPSRLVKSPRRPLAIAAHVRFGSLIWHSATPLCHCTRKGDLDVSAPGISLVFFRCYGPLGTTSGLST